MDFGDHARMDTLTNERQYLAVLLTEISTGCERAFNELYRRTRSCLYGVAFRLVRQPFKAEEVLQEAYLKVWTGARGFRSGLGTPMTWLITIVRNQAISRLRSEQLEHSLSDDLGRQEDWQARDDQQPDGDPVGGDALTQAFYAEKRMRISAHIAGLEPMQRQCLALAFEHGLSHSELSQHLGAPLGTVKCAIRRAIARLRACYKVA
ncbi:RNA polymerase sigma factor [Burkholderia sp. LMU1-1-1.1]|uniref:RNA polymerase sigma factor n=1 Tax=Burkholderia sp. LMU1-1-1.1 TaxID=3135266 RepID=UPI003416EF16